MLTWPIRIVDCKWRHGKGFSPGFQCCQIMTRYGKSRTVLFHVSPEWVLRQATSKLAMNVCVVLPPIANYPCIIACRRDNLNVGMCLDLSSFPWRVWFWDYLSMYDCQPHPLVQQINRNSRHGCWQNTKSSSLIRWYCLALRAAVTGFPNLHSTSKVLLPNYMEHF